MGVVLIKCAWLKFLRILILFPHPILNISTSAPDIHQYNIIIANLSTFNKLLHSKQSVRAVVHSIPKEAVCLSSAN